MVPDAGRGPTHLLKSTQKRLSRLRTYSLSQHGFQNLTMLFCQQESKSCTERLKPITSDPSYIHAYIYYTTKGEATQS